MLIKLSSIFNYIQKLIIKYKCILKINNKGQLQKYKGFYY